MFKLLLGVLFFGGMHMFSMLFPALRGRLAAHWGENVYKGMYSVASLVGLILLGWAYFELRADPSQSLYEPWYGGRHLTFVLVLIGFILIFANQSKGNIRKYVRHPFSLGVILWSTGHLLVNGETAVVVIFAMLLVLSLLDIVVSTARGQAMTFVPDVKHDIRAVVVGVVLYAVFMFGFHPYVLNVPITG